MSILGSKFGRLAIASSVISLSAWAVQAQDATVEYPHDVVTLVTHSSAGGGGDVFLRDMAGPLGKIMGVDFIVENAVGGSGGAAIARMANAPADGSVIYASNPTYVFTTFMSNLDPGYDDLTPVVNLFNDPQVIFARMDSPHASLADALAAAKAERKVWAAGAAGALGRMIMEQMKQIGDVNASILTAEGGGETILSILNGTADIAIGELLELQTQIDGGQVKLLGVLSEERLATHPDLPTAREQGIDLVVSKFRGLAGPPGLDPVAIAAWEKAIPLLLEDPDYKAIYTRGALEPAFMPYTEFSTFIETFGSNTGEFLKNVGVLAR